MAKYVCPSCGAAYNGKKCRQCLYEHFSEEIRHGLHTHQGEPLVMDVPARKPIRRKDPFGCEKKTRQKHPLAGFLVLLAIINSLMPLLRDWGLELEAREARHIAAEREPEYWVNPENRVVLHEEGPFCIYASGQDVENIAEGFTLYVQNDSNQDAIVYAPVILIDGFVMEFASLHCHIPANATGRTKLYLDETELEIAGIDRVHQLVFSLEVCDSDYTNLFTTDSIELGSSEIPAPPEFLGPALLEADGIRVLYLGYSESSYAEDEWELQFYVENNAERELYFYCQEAALMGLSTDDFILWSEIPPGARAVTTAYLDPDLVYSDLPTLDLKLSLALGDAEDPDFLLSIPTFIARITVEEKSL